MEQFDPVERKICRACNVLKKLKSFPILKSGNRAGVCSICKSTGKKIPKENKSPKNKLKNIELQLGFIRITDYVETYKNLEKMGYSLNEDIHEQFCRKYGLTPHSPKKRFLNHYSQRDCGLI